MKALFLIPLFWGFIYSLPIFSKEVKKGCSKCHYFPPQLNREGYIFKYEGTRTQFMKFLLPETKFSLRLKFFPFMWIKNEDESKLSFSLPEEIILYITPRSSSLLAGRIGLRLVKDGKIRGENLFLDLIPLAKNGINLRLGRFSPFDFSFSPSRCITKTPYSIYTIPLLSGREMCDVKNGFGIYGFKNVFYNLFVYLDEEGEKSADYSIRVGGFFQKLMFSLLFFGGKDGVSHDTVAFIMWGGESGVEFKGTYLKGLYIYGRKKFIGGDENFNGGFLEISHLFNKKIAGIRYDFESGDVRGLSRVILFANIPFYQGNFISLEYLFDLLNKKISKFILGFEFNF